MTNLENAPMASLFYRLEQLVERKDLVWFDRHISRVYSLLSDYGSASWKPFAWLLFLIFVTVILALLDGGAVSDNLPGWQQTLQGEECGTRLERAFLLALQATINPIGIFGVRNFVVPKTVLLTVWMIIHGIIAAILIALFVVAIRRRFKMS
jgi:hypothetical protein